MTRVRWEFDLPCPVCGEEIGMDVTFTSAAGDRFSPAESDVALALTNCPACNATWTGLEREQLENQAIAKSADEYARRDEGPWDTIDEAEGRA